MPPLALETPRLLLILDSTEPSPWTHGFSVTSRGTGAAVGSCGYKGPPDAEGAVEIAYGIAEPYHGRGYAKEVASALVDYALGPGGARRVFALTRPEVGPSTSVLTACGFECAGELLDPSVSWAAATARRSFRERGHGSTHAYPATKLAPVHSTRCRLA